MARHSFLVRTFGGSNPSIPSEEMAEGFKAADCKSVGFSIAGSNAAFFIQFS